MPIIDDIFDTFRRNGDALYDGGEVVTQSQHALQAAYFSEQQGNSNTLIAAALLHDYGHVMDKFGDSAESDIDGKHEFVGARFLEHHFVRAVTEPCKLHVAAKRYLCVTEADYFATLSPVSMRSLKLQGGPFTQAQAHAFEQKENYADAVQVRRYDERAKDPFIVTPDFEHFRPCLEAGLRSTA